MKLGVSHQTRDKLTDSRLAYLRALGVEALEVRIPAAQSSFDDILRIRDKVESAGMVLHEVMLMDKYSSAEVCLSLPGREETMSLLKRFICDLGRAGIGYTTYAWYTLGAYETHRATTRGCPTRGFGLDAALSMPNTFDRTFSDEDMWESYTRFIDEILPVAEDAGVRLQLHPNDPPVSHQGVARIFRDTGAFRRAMEISHHNPHSGLLFCIGCFAEMPGPDGKGVDINAAIREFGAQGHIHQVHFRNIDNHMPDFKEMFPDEGYVDLPGIVQTLAESGFDGMLVPDHVPDTSHLEGGWNVGEAFVFGYIRGLIQSARRMKAAASRGA
jgi:mannonate dehydratase